MSDDDTEKRVRELEKKFALATGVALVFAAWLGATNFYYIPIAAKKAAQDATSGQTEAEIRKLRDQAIADSAEVAKIAQKGTITIGGQCFQPKHVSHCVWGGFHMTSIVNDKKSCDGLPGAGGPGAGTMMPDEIILAPCGA